MAKKKKGGLLRTQRIVWTIVGGLAVFVLILAIRLLLKVEPYFP